MKKDTELYALAMPVFLLLFTPKSWLYLLPINLLIVFAALILSLKAMERPELTRPLAKKSLIPLWLSGFAGDLAGAGILLWLSSAASDSQGAFGLAMRFVRENPFLSTNALIIIFVCIIIAASVKYLLLLWLVFRKTDITPGEKRTLCLYLAIFTAPYTFIVPGLWLGFLA